MKKTNLLTKAFVVLFTLGAAISCVNVDNLSDENSIDEFNIIEHTPQIELGDAEVSNDENVIYIPVRYGVDKFPLRFKADVRYASPIDQVIGLNLNDELVLEDMNDELSFVVMAISGMPRRYRIVPLEVPYVAPEVMGVTVESVKGDHAMVYKTAYIENDVMTIYVLNVDFPLSIRPSFAPKDGTTVMRYAEDGELVDFENGEIPLLFEDANAFAYREKIVLADSDGIKRDVDVRVGLIEQTSGETGGGESLEYALPDIKPAIAKESQQPGLDLIGYKLNIVEDVITFGVAMDEESEEPIKFPISIDVEFADFGDNVVYQEIDSYPYTVTFESFDDTSVITAFDLAAGVAREWTFAIKDYSTTRTYDADILSFSYNYETDDVYTNVNIIGKGKDPKIAIVLDKSYVHIDNARKEIYLKMTTVNNAYSSWPYDHSDSWQLTLNVDDISVSEGASYEIDELFYHKNNAWQQTKNIRVTPKEGDPVDWTLIIKDFRNHTPSSANSLESFVLGNISPIMVSTDPEVPMAVDYEQNKIVINLTQDEGCYPMTVDVDYMVSEFATVSSPTSENPYRFVFDLYENAEGEKKATTHELQVTAENGDVAEWTIELNRPIVSSETKVTSFTVNSTSPSKFQVGRTEIDYDNSEILIYLNQSGSCPLTINYTMTLSRNARLGGNIKTKGSYTFQSLAQSWKFEVNNGANHQEWTVKFADWTPQLQNWQLDTWSGNNPSPVGSSSNPYWATANVSILGSGPCTTQVTGVTGSGAQLKSSKVVGKFAAGSLFLGWFDNNDPMAGLSDPVKLTYQGFEFAATRKIVAVEMDVQYSSGGNGSDSGSALVELLAHDPEAGSFVYHGRRPNGTYHPDNTAMPIARGHHIVGKSGVSGVNYPITPGVWTKMRINLDYNFDGKKHDPYVYTHLNIICSSSSKGDDFVGEYDSAMLIDNVRIIYEGDE